MGPLLETVIHSTWTPYKKETELDYCAMLTEVYITT